jgi:hypothetical protein
MINGTQLLNRAGGIVGSTVRIGNALLNRALHIRQAPKPEMDDVTLARKVESVIFRGQNAPKSTVSVNVVDGVVWLRGEVKRPAQVRSLEQKARAIPEVRGVENLLHLTKTPAPTRADTPRRQQRTRSSTRRPTPRLSTEGAVTDDRTDAIVTEAEPSPADHAQSGEGRSPAPLGSTGAEESQPSGGEETPPSSEA